MDAPAIPGLYGKMPAVGDFVSRRLPTGFIGAWDAWIQESFTISREQLDADWLDVYLTSPIWRFIMTSGNCGENSSAGILMPSVDRVGRYFPLTLAAVLDHRDDLPYLFTTAADWFDSLEQLALSALEDNCPLDDFDRRLQQLPLAPPSSSGGHLAAGSRHVRDGERIPIRIEMKDYLHLPQAFQQMTMCLLERRFTPYSMWSTEGSDLLNPSLLIYHGLPPAADFCGFLTGDWRRFGKGAPIGVSAFLLHPETEDGKSAGPGSATAKTDPARWQSCGLSDIGKVRSLNEDAFLERPQHAIWAVADGMGGHLAGDEASRAVVEGLSAVGASDALEALIDDVTAALQATNTALLHRSRAQGEGQIMGSTVVVMLAAGRRCATLWAGDSRLYRYRAGRLSQLTRDHSPDGEREDPRSSNPAAENSSNVITRALGADPELLLDTVTFEAMPGDKYLLCSDGLVKAVDAGEIEAILDRTGPEACARALIDRALEQNARDNVTVIVIEPV